MVERSILASGKGKRMDVIIHIPKGIKEQLEAAFGRDLAQAAAKHSPSKGIGPRG